MPRTAGYFVGPGSGRHIVMTVVSVLRTVRTVLDQRGGLKVQASQCAQSRALRGATSHNNEFSLGVSSGLSRAKDCHNKALQHKTNPFDWRNILSIGTSFNHFVGSMGCGWWV
ncbi:hypothetical protein EVAR_46452_1 [Eumeta japonica]|uniref:Uncharacterized protein n=1 Tax=Eumeta variegata TaxID=151549 RepID=A0A4C1XHG0_EUMVA|nr:hypothetical protein EVAR_46452_1 [Eumeta japonica]